MRQIGQQVARIAFRRRAQPALVTGIQRGRGRPLELHRVDLDRARVVEHDEFVPDDQQPVGRRPRPGQCTARNVQGLVQVPGGGDRLEIGPEPLQHLLPMPALPGCKREHCHQGTGLAQSPLPGVDGPAGDLHAERSEQLDSRSPSGKFHARHYARPAAGATAVLAWRTGRTEVDVGVGRGRLDLAPTGRLGIGSSDRAG